MWMFEIHIKIYINIKLYKEHKGGINIYNESILIKKILIKCCILNDFFKKSFY